MAEIDLKFMKAKEPVFSKMWAAADNEKPKRVRKTTKKKTTKKK